MNDTLKELQHTFLDYLLTGDASLMGRLAESEETAQVRMRIYHNAYRARLRETLTTDLPKLNAYLGDEAFHELCDDYCTLHPSCTRSLRGLATRLPLFLKDAPRYCELPALSELAAFELALMDAFDAADADQSSLKLAAINQADWPSLQIEFVPSVKLFASNGNTIGIWLALNDEVPPPEYAAIPEFWLIWRNQELVTEFRSINALEKSLVEGFMQGHRLASLAEQSDANLTISQNELIQEIAEKLQVWEADGLVHKYHTLAGH